MVNGFCSEIAEVRRRDDSDRLRHYQVKGVSGGPVPPTTKEIVPQRRRGLFAWLRDLLR
jgi:hypothetical protein